MEGVTEPGQIVDDIINAIVEPQSKFPWVFSDATLHARRMELVDHVMGEIGNNEVAQRIILSRARMGGYLDNVDDIRAALVEILTGI